ncbi:ABC transporter substrate-binding protein [Desertihabitans aurantiacus]|uniref:ABC transporter substrate-binding protein n=1 Tax=Desertihabitans aurantiacus TaxID=2282477 RepID=UPI000DF7A50F|nr:extracellular solute-binding protein [Desertihabitans aurantiacus]
MTLSRRGLLTAGAAAGGALLLPACGGGAGGGGGEPLRVSWYGGTPVHEGVEGALQAWGQAHPDVPYAVEKAPFDSYWDKLATQTAGNDTPDVLRMSMSYFSEYAGRGALADLGEAVGSTIRTDALDPDVATSGQLADGLFGIGQSSISHAVFVHAGLLEQVGVSVPTDWTWSTFQDFARGYAEEAGPDSWGCADLGGAFQTFEVFARQAGTGLFAPGGTGLAVSRETVEEWYAMWERLRADGAAPPGDVSAESTSFEESLLVRGSAPLLAGFVQQVTFYQPLVPDADVELVPLPSADGSPGDLSGQFLKALDLWCVSARSRRTEDAQRLVDFLLNDPAAVQSIGLTLGVPPSASSREAVAAGADAAAQRAIDYVDRIEPAVGESPEPWPAGYGELLSTFGRLNEDIAFGRSDPGTAAQQFVDAAAAALAH